MQGHTLREGCAGSSGQEEFERFRELRDANYSQKYKEFAVEHAAWIAENACPCPRCHVIIDKNLGCDTMVCVCGHKFQWKAAAQENKRKLLEEEARRKALAQLKAKVDAEAEAAAAIQDVQAKTKAAAENEADTVRAHTEGNTAASTELGEDVEQTEPRMLWSSEAMGGTRVRWLEVAHSCTMCKLRVL